MVSRTISRAFLMFDATLLNKLHELTNNAEVVDWQQVSNCLTETVLVKRTKKHQCLSIFHIIAHISRDFLYSRLYTSHASISRVT